MRPMRASCTTSEMRRLSVALGRPSKKSCDDDASAARPSRHTPVGWPAPFDPGHAARFANLALRPVAVSQFAGVCTEISLRIELGPALEGVVDRELHCYCLLYTSPSPRDGLLYRMPS